MDYKSNNKITKIKTKMGTRVQYLIVGILFGLLFPIFAILHELYSMHLDVAFESLSKVYSYNPLLIMISTAPFFFGIFSLVAGIRQANVEEEKKQLEIMKKEISARAYHDSLTGLPNRALLEERLNQILAFAHRHTMIAAILFIDIDNFKMVNDTFGHDQGDVVLKETANRIENIMREEETIARMGGDEFVAVVYNLRENRDVLRIAERIIDSVTKPIKLDKQYVNLGASIGVALYPTDGEDREVLIKNADIAMYHAKQNGKNRVETFSPLDEGKQ
ncbi:MAG: GGDEF domain-containing protein [Peptostreptococcaceae bacterium]|nr:GGDEF domain-containing protein [Peptostreptococcaceae bacterium]